MYSYKTPLNRVDFTVWSFFFFFLMRFSPVFNRVFKLKFKYSRWLLVTVMQVTLTFVRKIRSELAIALININLMLQLFDSKRCFSIQQLPAKIIIIITRILCFSSGCKFNSYIFNDQTHSKKKKKNHLIHISFGTFPLSMRSGRRTVDFRHLRARWHAVTRFGIYVLSFNDTNITMSVHFCWFWRTDVKTRCTNRECWLCYSGVMFLSKPTDFQKHREKKSRDNVTCSVPPPRSQFIR